MTSPQAMVNLIPRVEKDLKKNQNLLPAGRLPAATNFCLNVLLRETGKAVYSARLNVRCGVNKNERRWKKERKKKDTPLMLRACRQRSEGDISAAD